MKSFSKIILALMILVSSASAQTFTQKGTIELGGDVSMSAQTQTYKYTFNNFNTYYSESTSVMSTQNCRI